MRSVISLFSRSRSFAIGLTSASTKSRTERRIISCSGVTSGIVWLLAGIAFANQHRPLVLEHLFAALVVSGGAKLDHPAIGFRGIALGKHQRLRRDRVTGIHGREELEFLVAEMRNRALAQIFDRKPEHHVHHQHVIHNHILIAETLRILAIEIARVEIHGDAGEEAVVALGDSAAPMMLEKMANLEVFEIVATLDFAHRHMNQATFTDGRRIAKNPEAESFLTELHQARQPTIGLRTDQRFRNPLRKWGPEVLENRNSWRWSRVG